MFPRGTIYRSGFANQGFKNLHASKLTKIIFNALRGAGMGFLTISILFFIFAFGPIFQEEVFYFYRQNFKIFQKQESLQNLDTMRFLTEAEQTLEVQNKTSELNINSYFSVYIPKINAKANVIPNVDASDDTIYMSVLKEGIAHASGTNFPGGGQLIYLFSHSTNSPIWASRFGAVFYLLYKLNFGDEIIVYFADREYKYIVEKTIETAADDVSWLIDKGDGEKLVLQTCTPPGTNLRRLLVIARPI